MKQAVYGCLMAREPTHGERHRQSFLLNDLESLGFSTIRLNEFNDSRELGGLTDRIKESLLNEYRESYGVSRPSDLSETIASVAIE